MVSRYLFFSLLLYLLAGCHTGQQQPEAIDAVSDSAKYLLINEPVIAQKDWSRENNVVVQWLAEPDLLHPNNGLSGSKNELFLYLHTFLLLVDLQTHQLTPVLAESLPEVSDNGMSLKFRLRSEARWDDGSRITSSDVAFTIKAGKCKLTDNPHQKAVWNNLAGFQFGNDSLTFTLLMKQPYIHNISMWVDLPVIQKKFYDPEGLLDEFAVNQMEDSSLNSNPKIKKWAEQYNSGKYSRNVQFISGAGAYQISEWVAGQSIIITRKKHFWAEGLQGIYFNARPEKIIFKIIRDPNAASLDLLSQQSDISSVLSTRQLLQLKDDSLFNKHFYARFVNTFFYTYASMNNKPEIKGRKKIFDNKTVRKAMAYLTPVDEINRIVNKGLNKRMTGPVSFLKNEFNTQLKPIPYQQEIALQLLSEAGWTDTDGNRILDKVIDGRKTELEFSIMYMTTAPEWKDMASMMADAYRKAGMKVDLLPADYPAWITAAQQLNYDMMLGSWGQSSLPDDFTQIWHSASILSGGSNFSGFQNEMADALIDSIKAEMNDSRRAALSAQFQQLIYDEQPVIFLFSSVRRMAVHKRFEKIALYFDRPGILLNNLSLISFADVQP
jgi:peptide/nickel transport system substrate-binding protein